MGQIFLNSQPYSSGATEDNTKVAKNGDTMSGLLKFTNTSKNIEVPARSLSYVDGAKGNAGIYMPHTYNKDEWGPILCVQNKAGGSWSVGSYNGEDLEFVNFTKANIDSSTNDAKCNWKLSPTNGFVGPWNGITDDHNTNNTSDTWVPVYTGSKIQHRVIPKRYNTDFIGASNYVADTPAKMSADTGMFGIHWYSATGKVYNQPSQYGFRITCATEASANEQHSIWLEQNNGSIYHSGTNSTSTTGWKKIYDTGNLTTVDGSYTRVNANVSTDFKCWRFGNVVTLGGYFSCGTTIAGNTHLYTVPSPKYTTYFTLKHETNNGMYAFNIQTNGQLKTNQQIVAGTYLMTLTYVCT